MMIPFVFYTSFAWWWLEGRKSMVFPLQNDFYSAITNHEMDLKNAYWPDDVREQLRDNMRVAREQMEYYEVHTDYSDMKAESINRVPKFC